MAAEMTERSGLPIRKYFSDKGKWIVRVEKKEQEFQPTALWRMTNLKTNETVLFEISREVSVQNVRWHWFGLAGTKCCEATRCCCLLSSVL